MRLDILVTISILSVRAFAVLPIESYKHTENDSNAIKTIPFANSCNATDSECENFVQHEFSKSLEAGSSISIRVKRTPGISKNKCYIVTLKSKNNDEIFIMNCFSNGALQVGYLINGTVIKNRNDQYSNEFLWSKQAKPADPEQEVRMVIRIGNEYEVYVNDQMRVAVPKMFAESQIASLSVNNTRLLQARVYEALPDTVTDFEMRRPLPVGHELHMMLVTWTYRWKFAFRTGKKRPEWTGYPPLYIIESDDHMSKVHVKAGSQPFVTMYDIHYTHLKLEITELTITNRLNDLLIVRPNGERFTTAHDKDVNPHTDYRFVNWEQVRYMMDFSIRALPAAELNQTLEQQNVTDVILLENRLNIGDRLNFTIQLNTAFSLSLQSTGDNITSNVLEIGIKERSLMALIGANRSLYVMPNFDYTEYGHSPNTTTHIDTTVEKGGVYHFDVSLGKRGFEILINGGPTVHFVGYTKGLFENSATHSISHDGDSTVFGFHHQVRQ